MMRVHKIQFSSSVLALLSPLIVPALVAAPTREAAKVARTADLYFFGMIFACLLFVAGVIAWCFLRTPPGYVPKPNRRKDRSRSRSAQAAKSNPSPAFNSGSSGSERRHRSWTYREPLTAARAMHGMRGMGKSSAREPVQSSARTRKWRYSANGSRKSV